MELALADLVHVLLHLMAAVAAVRMVAAQLEDICCRLEVLTEVAVKQIPITTPELLQGAQVVALELAVTVVITATLAAEVAEVVGMAAEQVARTGHLAAEAVLRI
jgi:hypothetical protein